MRLFSTQRGLTCAYADRYAWGRSSPCIAITLSILAHSLFAAQISASVGVPSLSVGDASTMSSVWDRALTREACLITSDAIKSWTGASNDGLWTTSGNWTPSGVPVAGDAITFPTLASDYSVSNSQLSGGPSHALISFDGTATGKPTLSGGFNSAEILATSLGGATLAAGSYQFLNRATLRGLSQTVLSASGSLNSSDPDATLYLWDQSRLDVNAGGSILLSGNQSTIAIDDAASLNVNAGGSVTARYALISNDQTAGPRSLNINGPGANMRVEYQTLIHNAGFDSPASVANINVSNGGVFSSGIVEINSNPTAPGMTADTNITVDDGTFDVSDAVGFENSYFYTGISRGPGTTTLSLTNGGQFHVHDSDAIAFAVLSNSQLANTSIEIGGTNGSGTHSTMAIDGLLFAGQERAEVGDPITSTDIVVDAGGRFTVRDLSVFSADHGYVTNVTSNAGAIVDLGAAAYLSGGSEDVATSLGAGETHLDAAGGEIRAGSLELAHDSANDIPYGAVTSLRSAGIGAKIVAYGVDDPGTAEIDAGIFRSSSGNGQTGSHLAAYATIDIDIEAGGILEANEAFYAGDTQFGTTSITVRGAGSILDAGGLFAINAKGLASSIVTMSLINGGSVVANGFSDGDAGSITINTNGNSGAAIITLVGTNTTMQTNGSILIGGELFGSAQFIGTASTVTSGGGTAILAGGDVFVCAESTLSTGGRFEASRTLIGGNWTINGGDASRIVRSGAVVIFNNGAVALPNTNPAAPVLLVSRDVDILPTARLNLGANAIRIRPDVVSGMTLGELKVLLANGRSGTGVGGISSSAVTATRSVGYRLVHVNGSFLGEPTAAGDLLVRLTLHGDSDLNGGVDFDDLLALAQNYGTPGEWYEGDFNFDGAIDFDDLLSLAQNYGSTLLSAGDVSGNAGSFASDWALARSLVPEPSALLAGIWWAGLSRRRRS